MSIITRRTALATGAAVVTGTITASLAIKTAGVKAALSTVGLTLLIGGPQL